MEWSTGSFLIGVVLGYVLATIAAIVLVRWVQS